MSDEADALVARVRSNPVPVLIGAAWFALTYASTIWVWGINPKIFASPDEALNRFASGLLSKQGSPFLWLPFLDPEDLAHPRQWVSTGKYAIPSYAPVAIYAYAALLKLHGLGWVTALPALAAGAFAVGLAKLLPRGRQWLALPAPLAAFPAFYWLPRPWMNLSVLLICVCWTVYFWASWLESGRFWKLAAAIGLVGCAAAVRPDYAAYLMMVTLLLGLAQAPAEWRRITVAVLLAGTGAVVANLVLNWLVTGHPLVAAYQISVAREDGASTPPGATAGLLRQLILPMGLPSAHDALHSLSKYWVEMGPVALLLVGSLGIIPTLRKGGWLPTALRVTALLVLLLFVLSRMDPGLHGAAEKTGLARHSMPRYWAPVYLLAVIPLAQGVSLWKNRVVFAAMSVALCALSLASGYEIAWREAGSFRQLKGWVDKTAEELPWVQRRIPAGAMVYTASLDKAIWSYWRVGMLDEPAPTARSMRRAVEAGLDVWIYETHIGRARYDELTALLANDGISIRRVSWNGIYRLRRTRD